MEGDVDDAESHELMASLGYRAVGEPMTAPRAEVSAPDRHLCRGRHWYAVGVSTGIQAPVCERCGNPNPRWSDEKQRAYDEFMALPEPPDGEWVRCYDIEGEPADEEKAWCRTHQARVSIKTRGDNGPWHIYWRSFEAVE